jgi:hypothetical protein
MSLIPVEAWKAIFTSSGTALCSLAVGILVHWMQKKSRLKDLAIIATICGEALQDAIRAAGSSPKTPADTTSILEAAASAAKARILMNIPEIEASLEAELDVLIHGNIKQLAIAPGGATVVMPTLGAA